MTAPPSGALSMKVFFRDERLRWPAKSGRARMTEEHAVELAAAG